MPLPEIDGHAPDVIEAHDRPGPAWRVPRPVVVGGLAVVVVGGLALVAAQVGPGTAVVDASGSMVLHDRSSTLVDIPHSTQHEGRDSVFAGSIQVDLPDRQLVGEAEVQSSWAATVEDDVIMISHTWGQVHVTFDTTTCSGPWAWSAYREPRETGGALSLRCDDGSLFTATALLDRDEDATAAHPFRIFMTLEDGSYVAG